MVTRPNRASRDGPGAASGISAGVLPPGISQATLVLSTHRPETVPLAKALMSDHDTVILEEPEYQAFYPGGLMGDVAALRFRTIAGAAAMNDMFKEVRHTTTEKFLFVHTAGAYEYAHGNHRIGVIFFDQHGETVV